MFPVVEENLRSVITNMVPFVISDSYKEEKLLKLFVEKRFCEYYITYNTESQLFFCRKTRIANGPEKTFLSLLHLFGVYVIIILYCHIIPCRLFWQEDFFIDRLPYERMVSV